MINPLFAALGQTISDMIETQLPMAPLTSPIVYTVVNGIMDAHGQSLFMKKSVRDVLFGFKINLLETLDTFVNPLRRLGISLDALPPNPPDNMFGLLYGRNNTPEGEHEIYTGLHGTSHMFGYFASHKGQKALKFWKGEKCNQIVGSDGSLFPPFATSKTVLYAFAMDLCRSFYFNAIGTGEYKGIKGLLYTLPNEAFAAPNRLPDNECFCMFTGKRKEKRCSTEGVFDLGGCQGGAPLLVSKPHFIDTHPDLSKNVDGLNPDPEKHATFLILEPVRQNFMQSIIQKDKPTFLRLKNKADKTNNCHLTWLRSTFFLVVNCCVISTHHVFPQTFCTIEFSFILLVSQTFNFSFISQEIDLSIFRNKQPLAYSLCSAQVNLLMFFRLRLVVSLDRRNCNSLFELNEFLT